METVFLSSLPFLGIALKIFLAYFPFAISRDMKKSEEEEDTEFVG